MKAINKIVLLLATAVLGSCGQSEESKDVAETIRTAVALGDYKSIAQVDSICNEDIREDLAELAGEECDTASIAIRVVAQAPAELGESLAATLIDNIDKAPKDIFLKSLGITRFVYDKLGREDDFAIFNAAYQNAIDELPIDKQMQIYIAVSTPESMGQVLADDILRSRTVPKTDSITNAINERIAVLKTLYTPEEYDRMKTAFCRLMIGADSSNLTSIKF